MFHKVLFVSSIVFGFCDTAKILGVFPIPSISHQVVFRPITQELARRGHEVTVITADPVFSKEEALKNLTEIDVHDVSYEIWSAAFHKSTSNDHNDVFYQMGLAFQLIIDVFEAQMKTEKVSELLKKKSDYFDLVLVEAVGRPAYVFTHIFKAPALLVSSFGAGFGQFKGFGVPEHYTLYPEVTKQKLNDLSLWDKISEMYRVNKINRIVENLEPREDKVLQTLFGPDVPSMKELKYNFEMFFLNMYPIWDTNRPVPPNIIYMGGLHQNPYKELPQDLKSYLDESKNGIIYVSFGTNVSPSLFPAKKVAMMVNVFSKLPYSILWKWDKDVLPGQTKNIKIGKWFPQSDLLRYPNIKLFITQGGLQSTDEAITAGVPLLGMPMLGDQWYNVEKYVSFKIGQRLDMEHLTEEKFKNAIENIIDDKSYRQNIKNLRRQMHDQPMSSLDRTIWWMEYVIRHKGAKHLRSPAAGLSWAEYYELPLVLTLLSIALAVAISVTMTIKFVLRLVFGTSLKLKKK